MFMQMFPANLCNITEILEMSNVYTDFYWLYYQSILVHCLQAMKMNSYWKNIEIFYCVKREIECVCGGGLFFFSLFLKK